MTVSYTNFILDPVTTTPANAAGHGHIQYFRNGAKCDGACAAGAAYETNAPLFAFHGLVAGDKISAELVNNNNTSLTPVVKQEITVPSAASSSTLTTTPTTVTTTVRITRSHSSSGTIPAVGPVLIVALVAAVFLTRRKL